MTTNHPTPMASLLRCRRLVILLLLAPAVGSSLRVGAAAFTDANWTALGSGMNSTVDWLTVSGSNVYAGGTFTNAGGIAANRIDKWDGNSWSALGSGMNPA